jgi:hypothetical protein
VARRFRARVGVLFTALLVVVALAGPGVAPVAGSSRVIDGIDVQLPTGNSISGTLKNGDGDPITGFSLSACTPDEDCVADGQTDGSGAWAIRGLTPGSYLIQFAPIDTSDYVRGWYSAGGPVVDAVDATPIDASGGDVAGVAVVADTGFSISGTVTGAGAGALAGVTVSADGESDSGAALTNGAGQYTIRGLRDGSYRLQIRVPPSLNFRSGGVAGGAVIYDEFGGDVFALNGANATGKNIVAPAGLRISGTLTGTGGAGAGVVAFGETATSDQVFANGSGQWSIGGLWPGTYQLVFAQKQTSEFDVLFPLGYWTAGGTLTSDPASASNIVLTSANVSNRNAAVPNGLSVAGTVTGDDGSPLKDAAVFVCGDLGSCAATTTSASGGWKLDFLTPDHYLVQVGEANHVAGYFGAGGYAIDDAAATRIHVTNADIVGADVVLPAGAVFTGHVTGPLGEDVAGAEVFASGTGGIGPGAAGGGVTDANGVFILRGLSEDDYQVRVNLPPFSPYIAGYYDDAAPGNYTTDFAAATVISLGDAAVGSSFVPIAPKRVVDSRTPPVGVTGIFSTGVPRTFKVAGVSPIPANAVAVTGNITVVGQTSSGFVSLTPTPIANPKSSTLNFPIGDVRANNFTVPLSADGKLSAVFRGATGSKAHVIVDITGYFVEGDTHATYKTIETPTRVLDTRPGGVGLAGAFKANVPRTLSVAGDHNIPADAKAITGNLTVVGQTHAGYLSVTPTPQVDPQSSTLNFPLGDIRANGLTAQLNASGDLSIVFKAASGTAHVILDVTGYYRNTPSGALFYPLPPARLVDTRPGVLATELAGTFAMGTPRSFEAIGHGGVSLHATALTGNLTIVGQTGAGYASVTPQPDATPDTSTINFPLADTRANGVTVPLNIDGELSIVYRSTPGKKTHVLVDVTGYFR